MTATAIKPYTLWIEDDEGPFPTGEDDGAMQMHPEKFVQDTPDTFVHNGLTYKRVAAIGTNSLLHRILQSNIDIGDGKLEVLLCRRSGSDLPWAYATLRGSRSLGTIQAQIGTLMTVVSMEAGQKVGHTII